MAEGKATQVEQLLKIAESAELSHSSDGTTYATVEVGGQVETIAIRSLEPWLRKRFFEENRKTPASRSVTEALNQLDAVALYEGRNARPFIRTGTDGDNVYVDLGDQVVEVDTGGWRLVRKHRSCPSSPGYRAAAQT